MDRKRKGALILFQSLLEKSRKRRRLLEEEVDQMLSSLDEPQEENSHEEEGNMLGAISYAAVLASTSNRGGPRRPAIDRVQQKEMWSAGYVNWDESRFKARVRVNRETFNYILGEISPYIAKTPTNFRPNPIEPHRQLGLTLYRLGHGCDFQVIEDVFGVSKSLAVQTFNQVIRVMILRYEF